MRLLATCTLSMVLFAFASLVPPVYAQQCSSGCYTQQSADMRQCPAKYTAEDKAACRRAASEAAAACVRACSQRKKEWQENQQGDKQQELAPTKNHPVPLPY